MFVDVNGSPIWYYTGGKAWQAGQPTVVMIHGVLHDHSVWILQSRWLAHHGWNVLVPDLPGHCRSAGTPPGTVTPPTTVEEAADFVLSLLQALHIPTAVLVGHSLGSLIALEAAARAPQTVRQLVLVGTASPMRVSPALLDASLHHPLQALHMVNQFSRSTLAPPPSALGPGTWVYGASLALGKRVLASNPTTNLFHTGFLACDRYQNAEHAIAQVQCPTLFALGQTDQMTPPKAAQGLIARARDAKVVMLPGGHHQMTETPEEMLGALRGFLVK